MTVLWGRQHEEYGRVATAAPSPSVAVALSRGLHPKPYAWTDPNEDVVAAVVGPRAALLVVADAHGGAIASEAAVASVLQAFGDDPPPSLTDAVLVRLFHHAGVAVATACEQRCDDERRGSRTTLSLALVAGRRLCWAALGDSPVMVVEGRHGMEVSSPDQHFVGAPMALHRIDRYLQRGRGTLGERAWVAVTSDGFSNFAAGPGDSGAAGAAAEALEQVVDAPDGARALVERAFTGGAGDNVAAAVVAPPQW